MADAEGELALQANRSSSSSMAAHGWPELGRGLTAPSSLVLLASNRAGEPSGASGEPAVAAAAAAAAAVAAKQQQKKAKAQRHFLDMEAELRWVVAG